MAGGQLNSFIDRLFQAVPADQQAAVRSTYSQLADRVSALEANADAVQTTAQQQRAWWEQNKDAAAERDRLKTELEAAKSGKGTGLDQNEITAAIQAAQAQTLETGLGLVTTIANIAVGHSLEFGEHLDTVKLANEAINAKMPIDQYYAQTVATRRAERAQAALDEKLRAARAEGEQAGRQEVLDRLPGKSLPFPSASQANGPTTLAGLRKIEAGQPNPFSLEAAVQTANEVAAKQ